MNRLRMIVIDSSHESKNTIKFALEKAYREVDIDDSNDYLDALIKIQEKHYDLLIINISDKELNFIEIIKTFKSKKGINSHTLIIAPREAKEDVIECLKEGADGYITLPFTIDAVLRKLAELHEKFDRREFERHGLSGKVEIIFEDKKTRGDIVDISLGGVLMNLSKKDPIPHILDKVKINFLTEGVGDVFTIEAVVIRIQAIDITVVSDKARFAFKFNEVEAEKKVKLKEIVEELKSLL
ncbi:MAG: PilZ domain-containing protein [Thermodesulfovibrionales bacterium]|nr:PilZ domain-containing protein [Thermodesulfovibrionales bacterium]